jgi:hypothetical protein
MGAVVLSADKIGAGKPDGRLSRIQGNPRQGAIARVSEAPRTSDHRFGLNPPLPGRFRMCETWQALRPFEHYFVEQQKMNKPAFVPGDTREAIGPLIQSESVSAVRLPTDLTAEIDAWANHHEISLSDAMSARSRLG